MRIITVIIVSSLAMAGCSSNVELRKEAALEASKANSQHLTNAVNAIPDWYLDVPSDATGIYGVGFGEADKPHSSLQMSELKARFDLAKQIKQIVSGQERASENIGNDAKVNAQSQTLIDTLVAEIELTGVERIEREVKVVEGVVHSYSLLKMPYQQYNQLLQLAQDKSRDPTMEQAIDKMLARIRERQVNMQPEQATDGQ